METIKGARAHEKRRPASRLPINTISDLPANLDSKTAREVQLFGEHLSREVHIWKHIQVQRLNGPAFETHAAQIAKHYGVSLEWGRMAARILKGRARHG